MVWNAFAHLFLARAERAFILQAIAGALAVNGAIALIDLDLRDNPLTEAGLTALVRPWPLEDERVQG